MFFGRQRRTGSFSLRLAVRATLTAVVAIVAAGVFESRAQSKLQGELTGMHLQPPASLGWLGVFQGHLQYVPVPALLLGVAALVLRPLRPILAPLAMVATLLAVLIVVGSLLAAMAPLYRMPAELDLK